MTLQFLDDLRPNPEPFDLDWSAETLASILAEPAPEPRISRRRLVLITIPLATAFAFTAVLAPSFLGSDEGGHLGASADAAAALTKAASALEKQTPSKDEYLHIKHVDRYWTNGIAQPTRGTYEDWVPGDRSRPMIEQTTEDGRITDTGAHSLDDYDTNYYTDHGRDADELLEDLNQAAINQDSDEGDRSKNIWDQAFRELQQAEVPVKFKAAVLRALTRMPGVSVVPTTNTVGNLEGTALIVDDNDLAFVVDRESGAFLGWSAGIDNPKAPETKYQSTSAVVTNIVESAPKPDYGP